jgi:NAD(P)-dependent dehydrogenase (short-subunit alcohol dehydrogenase family)
MGGRIKLKALKDQVVVVIGAATGIGRLAAREFARRGAKVVVSARDVDALASLVDEIHADGGEAFSIRCDVEDAIEVQAVAHAAERQYGRIDTWINMAAVSLYAPFTRITEDEWRHIVSVDLLGYANGSRAAIPALKRAGGGALINVGSVESRVALPLQSAYAAAKHGVLGMTDALRLEIKHDRTPISVTSILPASVDTPLFDRALTKLGVKPRPLPPVYRPERVVGAVLWAAEHPTRELVVGGAGRVLMAMRALAPGLSDAVLSRVGYRLQRSREPREWNATNAFMSPMEDERIKGQEAAPIGPIRPPGFMERHPRAGALALLGVLMLLGRLWRGQRA